MLGRLVQGGLAQLELLTGGAGAFRQSLEIVGARFERGHRRVHFSYTALGTLDRRDRGRHELLDTGSLVGASRQRSEALVRSRHARQQLAAPLVELRAK